MKTALNISAAVIAIALGGIGAAWLTAPSIVLPQFGLALPDGAGRSTLIADIGSFFLTCGCSVAIALRTGRRLWYYIPIMLVTIAAAGRILAWIAHGAPLLVDMIGAELIMASVLFAASLRLARDD